MNDPTITTGQALRRLGISKSTFDRRRRAHGIEPATRGQGQGAEHRWHEHDIAALLLEPPSGQAALLPADAPRPDAGHPPDLAVRLAYVAGLATQRAVIAEARAESAETRSHELAEEVGRLKAALEHHRRRPWWRRLTRH